MITTDTLVDVGLDTLTASGAHALVEDVCHYRSLQRGLTEEDESRENRLRLARALRPARPEDYAAWLCGYLAWRGKPTHYHDYPFIADYWFVAIRSFRLLPCYGPDSVNIIVPSWIDVTGSDPGHNDVYFYDGFRTVGPSDLYVPVFSDVEFMQHERLREFADAQGRVL